MSDPFVTRTVQRHGQSPIEVRLSLAIGSDGVHLAFEDGRSITLSVDEWIAVAVFALIDASAWREDVVRAWRDILISILAGPLLHAAAGFNEAAGDFQKQVSKIAEATPEAHVIADALQPCDGPSCRRPGCLGRPLRPGEAP